MKSIIVSQMGNSNIYINVNNCTCNTWQIPKFEDNAVMAVLKDDDVTADTLVSMLGILKAHVGNSEVLSSKIDSLIKYFFEGDDKLSSSIENLVF